MLYATFKLAHVAAVILWVGGMVFAHFFLRPAVQALDPPQRLALMHAVLRRFLDAVLWAVIVVVGSGLVLMLWGAWVGQAVAPLLPPMASKDGLGLPHHWMAMATLGLVMAAIFGHIRFVLFPRLARAVAAREWPAGGAAMNAIRRWVSVNLTLGGAILLVAYLRWPG